MSVAYRPKVIWITRSQPFGLKIARLCGSEGVPALSVPVLQVIPLAVSRPDQAPDAILFTSAHGVRNHPYNPQWKEVPVLAVGDGTAEQALAKGYATVHSASGDVEDLKKLVRKQLPAGSHLCLFSARETAGELELDLHRDGYRVERKIVYETRVSTDAELRHAIDLLDRINGICVYSPKGARRVSEALRNRDWKGTIFCLSQACADQIESGEGVEILIARRPNDAALRHLVRSAWGLAEPGRDRSAAADGLEDSRAGLREVSANDNLVATRERGVDHSTTSKKPFPIA
jgi:uroporphyrinogen-III synthase